MFNGDEVILKNITFEHLSKLLPANQFCRVNKSEVIALKAIQVFTFDEITANLIYQDNLLRLSLNEKYRNDFLEKVKNI